MVKTTKLINNKTNKTSVITVRVTEHEKKRLKKIAKANDTDISKYLISSAFNNRTQKARDRPADPYCAVMVQQIYNYISKHYGNDNFLEEKRRELWEHLQLK